MREIKFRAWLASEKRMVTPFVEINNENLPNCYGSTAPRHPLMQYTGLKDRNGIEIYEGDVLIAKESVCRGDGTWDDAIYSVKWRNESACFIALEADNADWTFIDDLDFEVIGNIHETPNMLEHDNG